MSFYSHHQEVDAVTIIPFTDDLTAQRAHMAQEETITEAALSPGLGSRALAAFLGNEVQCSHMLTRSTQPGIFHPHFMNEGTEAQGNSPQALWGSSPGRVAGLGRILPHHRCSNGTDLVSPGRRWGLESSWPQLGGSGGGAHL